MNNAKPEIVSGLKEKYKHLHPLLFCRSVEKAETLGELFDILHTVPNELPLVWNEESRRWKKNEDLYVKQRLKLLKMP